MIYSFFSSTPSLKIHLKMDDEAGKEETTIRHDITRIALSVIPMFMLLRILYIGFKLVAKHDTDAKYNRSAFSLGVVTLLLGFIFVVIGLAVVAELALNLTARLQHDEEKKNGIQQARGTKSIHREIARILATVISMFMLLWFIYTGFRLATEPKSDGNYHHLAFSIGVVTIAFALIYFIIGISIVADLVLHFLSRLKQKQQQQQRKEFDSLM